MKNFWTISKSFHRPYNWLYWGGWWILPLAWIEDLTATESWWTVSLTWTDPDDIVKWWKTITAWTSTKIVRKEWSAPTDSTDWDLILTETTKNQYSSSWYVDSTITADWTYYYVAFAVADSWLETISNIESVSVVVATYKTYTIVRQEVSWPSSMFIEYKDDAVWMTQWSTDFDEFFWYSAVLLDWSWNEVEEVVQSSPWTLNMNSFQWALTWTANNVMIKFPRRWIKMSKSWNQVSLSITDDPNKAWFQYYAFTKWETIKNYLYLWAFKWWFTDDNSSIASSFTSWTTKLKSRWSKFLRRNYSPAGNVAKSDFRNSAQLNWLWYWITTLYARRYINCLYMMKYWNPKSASIVWKWFTNSWQPDPPWSTLDRTDATYWSPSWNTIPVKLFWLEDRRWNVNDMLDCCRVDENSNLKVDKTNSIFQESAYTTNLWTVADWYLNEIVWTNDWMFTRITTTWWSSTQYYTNPNSFGSSCDLWGGWYWYSRSCWIFFLQNIGSATTSEYFWARLMYL